MTAETILLNSFTGFFYVLGPYFLGISAMFIFYALLIGFYNFLFKDNS